METALKEFFICFVPLFVAVDAFGVLPLFISLTEDLPPARIRSLVLQSVVTASLVAVTFLLAGTALLSLLGITVADFTVAGGSLLFVISMTDLVSSGLVRKEQDYSVLGAVPIGVPLITGPAVLTTCLLLLHQHGVVATLAAVVANVLLAGGVFYFAVPITRYLGHAGTKTLSKIASLLLAAIAVMMIRKGVFELIALNHR